MKGLAEIIREIAANHKLSIPVGEGEYTIYLDNLNVDKTMTDIKLGFQLVNGVSIQNVLRLFNPDEVDVWSFHTDGNGLLDIELKVKEGAIEFKDLYKIIVN